jgi:hypothetical protein
LNQFNKGSKKSLSKIITVDFVIFVICPFQGS